MRYERVSWQVLVAIYLPPAAALAVVTLRLLVEETSPQVTVATFAFLEHGLPLAVGALHVIGVGVLAGSSVARARIRLGPTWSAIPAFVYYALVLALLVLLALGSDVPPPEILAI